ncbi:MAG: hypothetical protein VX593_06400 [Pseudomonadota bacterium]|nr:hypothetical protein [Pseudomonadota bacterium]
MNFRPDAPSLPFVAMCESDTHAAMIEALVNEAKVQIDHVVATNRFDPLSSLVPVTLLDLPNDTSPATAWKAAQQSVSLLLSDRRLLQFQDQGWLAQAVSMAARSAGAHRTLLQDGFLSFDMQRSLGLRRWLWPLTSRLDRLAPHTPRPRLRTRLNGLLYRHHTFGITRPDRALVFGEAMRSRLINQWGLDPDQVEVTGPLLRPDRLADDYRPPATDRPLRVLFLDQCFLRYRRMSRKDWQNRYLPLIGALSQYELSVKLHPSQTEADAAEVTDAAGEDAAVIGRERLSDAGINLDVDVAVTVSSTAFVNCLAAGIPVIFCESGALDVMPELHHPLVRNCAFPRETVAALERFRQSGKFPANAHGESLNHHIAMTPRRTVTAALTHASTATL